MAAFFWMGCAAQNARFTEKQAEKLLKEAKALKPNAPETKEASAKLASARRFLASARYDKADEALRESIEASEKALGMADEPAPAPSVAPASQPPPQPVEVSASETSKVENTQVPTTAAPANDSSASTLAPATPSEPAPKMEFSQQEPTKVEAPVTKRGMPAKALAKYLASKHALGTNLSEPKELEPKAEKPSSEKASAPKPAQKSEAPAITEQAHAKTEAAAEKSTSEKVAAKPEVVRSKDSKLPGGAGSTSIVEEANTADQVENNKIAVAKPKVVEAPATKTLKKAPEKKAIDEDEKFVEAPKEPAQPKVATRGLAKRKIPGSIDFKVNDPSIQGDAATNLDQTSKFLLDNPSTTLILQGVSASGELTNLIDSRFESIRSYLTAKGVPDDQIRLDPERKSGKAPVFELFLIEH